MKKILVTGANGFIGRNITKRLLVNNVVDVYCRDIREDDPSWIKENQVKRDTAIELLTTSECSIEDISLRLGFAETSPFTRTFKQWTGVPPSAYRKRNR